MNEEIIQFIASNRI